MPSILPQERAARQGRPFNINYLLLFYFQGVFWETAELVNAIWSPGIGYRY